MNNLPKEKRKKFLYIPRIKYNSCKNCHKWIGWKAFFCFWKPTKLCLACQDNQKLEQRVKQWSQRVQKDKKSHE